MTLSAAPQITSDDPLLLDQQLCFPLYAATNLLNRLYGPVLGPLSLTYPQYLVMLVLWEHEVQTVGELGARLYLDSGTLTPLLKRMEAAGHVSRARDPNDERRVLVTLTDRGRALRDRAVEVPKTLSAGLEPEGLEELRGSIRAFVSMLARQVAGASASSSPPIR